MRHKHYMFNPIPGVKTGLTHLSIHPPGSFMDNVDYMVFVGGCGVGHAKTLEKAKSLLLTMAKVYCSWQVEDSERVTGHYKKQLAQLDANGLGSVIRE